MFAIFVCALPSAAGWSLQEESKAPSLEIVAVRVQPQKVAKDTLCRLEVEVKNLGSEAADALGFDVLVGGQALKIYESQLFLDPLAAGESKTIQLFNFWSSEDGRELPTTGDLDVEVRLREALWVRLGRQEAEEAPEGESVQTWESLGDVPGLPVSGRVQVKIER